MYIYKRYILVIEAAKMKQLQERGDVARYHGQIGRSQTHYTVDDFPLMRRVLSEDLWPILQEIVLFLCSVFVLALYSLFLPVPPASMSHAQARECLCPGEIAPAGYLRGRRTRRAVAVARAVASATASDR